MTTFTENGAASHSTTGDPRLDLFSKITRDTPELYLRSLLSASWNKDPQDTIKIIFHLRDCRGGKGEREQFYRALKWMMETHPHDLKENLKHIPFYGSFKDLLTFLSTPLEKEMLSVFTHQLLIDKILLGYGQNLNTTDLKLILGQNNISLAAKYAPTEGGFHDTKHQAVKKFCQAMGCKCSKRDYRKEIIGPLRKQIDANSILVERHMTDKPEDWAQIDFSKVSSVALKKYKKAWVRHQPERYQAYLDDVKKGVKKMNVLRLMPHEIVGPYLKPESSIDETIEAQWISFVEQTRKTTKFTNALAVVDVSGSMEGKKGDKVPPINVAISLGLLLAELTEGPFHNKFFTFSSTPLLENVKGSTLYEKATALQRAHWDGSTNFQSVFDVLLTSAKMFGCTDAQMPRTIFAFSDMQFDRASDQPNWDVLKTKYQESGYTLPRLVFWNLRGNTIDFPVTATESNVALIGGFSADLLKLIIDGEELNPLELMFKAIHNDRYSRITLSELFVVKNTNYGWAGDATKEWETRIKPSIPENQVGSW